MDIDDTQNEPITEIIFPFEFVVMGVPVSLQNKSGQSGAKGQWQDRVRQAWRKKHPSGSFNTSDDVELTIFYFLPGKMQGDLDNIVKPIVDALVPDLLADDSQVARIVVQRFDQDMSPEFPNTSPTLFSCMSMTGDRIYVRVSDRLFEDD